MGWLKDKADKENREKENKKKCNKGFKAVVQKKGKSNKGCSKDADQNKKPKLQLLKG